MSKSRTATPLDGAFAPLSAATRRQAAFAAACATAMFRGVETMRKVQEQAAHEAAARHAAAALKLQGECGPAEVCAIHSELLRFDVEANVRYWKQMAAAAMEMQVQMLASTGEMIDADTVIETVSALTPKPH